MKGDSIARAEVKNKNKSFILSYRLVESLVNIKSRTFAFLKNRGMPNKKGKVLEVVGACL